MAERKCFPIELAETYLVFEFGAVGETENHVGEGVEGFEEMGAVDSGICGVQVNSDLFPGREWPMGEQLGKIGERQWN